MIKQEKAKVIPAERRGGVLYLLLQFRGDAEPSESQASLSPGALAYFAPGAWVDVWRDTNRGGRRRKVALAEVKRVIRRLGEGASQKAVAEELNVSTRTLHRLVARGEKSWEELITNAYNLSDEV